MRMVMESGGSFLFLVHFPCLLSAGIKKTASSRLASSFSAFLALSQCQAQLDLERPHEWAGIGMSLLIFPFL